MTRWPMHAVFLGLVFVACEEDGADDSTCTLSGEVSGALATKLPGSRDVACLTQHGSGDGVDVEYLVLDPPISSVHLVIADVTKGMTGDFQASLSVDDEDGNTWRSGGCSVSIAAHDFRAPEQFGDKYLVRGDGTCFVPLQPDTGAATLTVTPFSFVVEVTWAD